MYLTIERVVLLKQVPIFAGISNKVLSELALRCQQKSFEPGEYLFEKDDRADSLYIIISGELRLHQEKQNFADLKPGEFLGEIDVLSPDITNYWLLSLEESEILVLDQKTLQYFMEEHVEIALQIVINQGQTLRAHLTSQYRMEPANSN